MVRVGSARSDENGKISGGKAGDQTRKEVSIQNWYLHSKGWVIIRAKDPVAREKIAKCMEAACNNDHIGYDQYQNTTMFNEAVKFGYDCSKINIDVETDCSKTVRCCSYYAGIPVNNFTTGNQVTAFKATGKYDIITDSKFTKSSDYLLRGDILVTKTQGHTVVVLDNGAKVAPVPVSNVNVTSSNKKPSVAKPIIKSGSKGEEAKNLQMDLNYVMKVNLTVDGSFGPKSVAALKLWQKTYGLVDDGVYGDKSKTKMTECLSSK